MYKTSSINTTSKLKLLTIMLLVLFSISLAFANVNSGTFSQTNGGGVPLNYEFSGNLSAQSYEDVYTFQGGIGTDSSVVCDIDKDGKAELITANGNTIFIRGMTIDNELVIEEEFYVTAQGGTMEQINSIACVKLWGDAENDDILVIHQGANVWSDSVLTNNNDILYIERWTEKTLSQNITYGVGNNYNLLGFESNKSQIMYGELACDGISILGEELLVDCIYGNAMEISLLGLPSILDFNCDFCSETLDLTLTKKLLPIAETSIDDTANQIQHYEILLDSVGNRFIHLYQTDGNIDLNAYKVNGQVGTNMTWELQNDWNFYTTIQFGGKLTRVTTATPNEDIICLTAQGEGGGNVNHAYHSCANKDGSINTIDNYAQPSNPTYRQASYIGNAYFDNNRDGVPQKFLWRGYGSVIDTFFTPWNSVIQQSAGNFPDQDCGFSRTASIVKCTADLLVSRYAGDSNTTFMVAGNNWATYNRNTGSFLSRGIFNHPPSSNIRAIDLNNDFGLELIARDFQTGLTYVYTQDAVTTTPSAPVELINTSIVGDGYFGFYSGENCAGVVEFKATECIGEATDCTYNATNPLSQERIYSTCGNTQSLSAGLYSYASPVKQCSFTAGDYNVTLQMESTEELGIDWATNTPPIAISFIDGTLGVDCNIPAELLQAPSTEINEVVVVGNETGNGGGGATQPTVDPLEQPVVYMFQLVFGNVPPAIKFLLTIVIVLGLAIFTHNRTGGNQLMVSIAGALGVGLAVIFTLLSIEVALIGVIVFCIVAVVLHKFNNPVLSGGI